MTAVHASTADTLIEELSPAGRRIAALIRMEENRSQRDAAGVCIPMNMDAAVRTAAFKQCLQIVKEEHGNR